LFSRWPIRVKLWLVLSLLLAMVTVLAGSGFLGSYAYRGLVRSISRRVSELPLAMDLSRTVSELRVTLSQVRRPATIQHPVDTQIIREEFRANLQSVKATLERYRRELRANAEVDGNEPIISDSRREWETVALIEQSLARIDQLNRDEDWVFNQLKTEALGDELQQLDQLTSSLPGFLRERMQTFAADVRVQYRAWIVVTWVTSLLAFVLLASIVGIFYVWIFNPLQELIAGSRRVASGEFQHRIQLSTNDEMAELAGAMNDMTAGFREIRDDLDRQVRERTRQVVRSEQLASVGFLAAGVAHEINNPLASIAWSAEALESRLADILADDDAQPDDEHNQEIAILRDYLRRIQDEAFRCKGITEKLLDFSRLGDVEPHDTELCELVQGVIEMVRHVGKYRHKNIELHAAGPVVAAVNAQEIKQVVLNLITNALDALDPGGTVRVRVGTAADQAEILVTDNGCGMTEDVRQHLFEPFFTRRRDGQGTGLGLSIAYRIVTDHGGYIEATSEGPGCGSQFRVTLPLACSSAARRKNHKEPDHRHQAA
jgi:two-component system NtrC family sensor kinase